MKLSAALLVLLPVVLAFRVPKSPPNGENWVVLVAGSNGWTNYRHQADICHAYQIMHANGVPDDHIIVMMYDDIADNCRNPSKGKIFNSPSLIKDVYARVPKDYTKDDVTVETFFNVLQGNVEALKGTGSGKVVKSGPNDRIFINFDDHGGPEVFTFPYGYMHADDFADVVQKMHAANKYKEMMVYMESCYSGSMFENHFPDNIGFYALSASSPDESSYAAYCYVPHYPCLGDAFSVNWMMDTEANDPATETLKEQFENTKSMTFHSCVMQWGDLTIENEVVSTFFSASSSSSKTQPRQRKMRTLSPMHQCALKLASSQQQKKMIMSKGYSVRSQDVPLIWLEQELSSAKSDVEKETIRQEIISLKQKREFVKETMKKIILSITGNEKLTEELMEDTKYSKITNRICYKSAVKTFHNNCFNIGQSTYALSVLHTLVDLCEAGYDGKEIISVINNVCTFPTIRDAV